MKRFQNREPAVADQSSTTGDRSAGNSADTGEIFAHTGMGQERAGANSAGAGEIFANAQVSQKQIKEFRTLSGESRGLLHKAVEEFGFSAREQFK